eukprot:TRINITY_DN12354_c0_g1_i1.p1 TRINITY_DN12354_c0_g1~~TRINITY_DN12354_c0_g1_i1.p1  ORF type:complete len:228 (+),score=77.72 TRINITY_DN12354_c0_g1_i1:132-815(+)
MCIRDSINAEYGDRLSPPMAAGEWVVFCLLAVLTKLSSSVDDVAWLLPYINAKAAGLNALLYVFLMECVVGLAIAAGIGGRQAMSSIVSEDGYWNTERVLSLVSGCLLTVYAVYLFYDWWTELEDDDDNSDNEAGSDTEPNPVEAAAQKCDESVGAGPEDLEEQHVEGEEPSSTTSGAATLRRRQRPGGGGQGAWTEAHEAVRATQLEEQAGGATAEEEVDLSLIHI